MPSLFANQRGLALTSILISIAVFLLGITAVIALALNSLRLSEENKERLEALELAKEGLELVRNLRDSNWKQNYPWNSSALANPYLSEGEKLLQAGKFYALENNFQEGQASWTIRTTTENKCDGQNILKIKDYFCRLLTINYSDNLMQVTSTVTWKSYGREKKESLVTVLGNWREI